MLEHTHAIVILKNNNGEYLQYFDKRWNCFLFPNCKLVNDNHLQTIKEYLQKTLNIEVGAININYVTDIIHEKYSVSAGKMKEYHHYFYVIKETNFCEFHSEKHFEINTLKFLWMSLADLEADEQVQKVNSDIVSYIKQVEQ